MDFINQNKEEFIMSKEIINEAIYMIACTQHISEEYITSVFSEEEIVYFAREINRTREENMDAIRENW